MFAALTVFWLAMSAVESIRARRFENELGRLSLPRSTIMATSDGPTAEQLQSNSDYAAGGGGVVRRQPECWRRYEELRFGHAPVSLPILFIGRLQNGPIIRIVVVRLGADGGIVAQSVSIGRPLFAGFQSTENFMYFGLEPILDPMTYYAGYVEPTDESKFVIPYSFANHIGAIIGQLSSDGDLQVGRSAD
jgi:hypothetical protein